MGVNDRANENKARKSRGSTNNVSRLAGLGKNGSGQGQADWGDCDPVWIAGLVVLLTKAGGAVRFGASRDGAVLSIGIYLDGDSVTLWLDGAGTYEEQISRIYENLKGRLGE